MRVTAPQVSLLGILGVVALVGAGCGPTITAPDVVGMRLDAAHREFEALEVDDFDDVDVIGEEDSILLDANWVVVRQDPAAGTKDVDTGDTIKLEVGHEDDSKVLEMIPAESDFAVEMADEAEPSEEPSPAEEDTEPTGEPTETAETAPTEEASSSGPSNEERTAAVECARRKGNPGEIYVWYSYGNDQPPDALRLGAGFVWDFGSEECITSTEFALRTNPLTEGYCTEVGKVAANPAYRVNARPAPRIPNIIAAEGDC